MNFIIYEDEKKFVEVYKKAICKLMGPSNIHYKIIEINAYDLKTIKSLKQLNGNKIFILDIEVPGKMGLDLARDIRNSGDWHSPIIVVTSHDEFKLVGYTGRILMLDFISKTGSVLRELYESLLVARDILMNEKTLCFQTKGETYQIPYQDILYIKKNIYDNSSLVVTNTDEYLVRKSINKLESILDPTVFFKSHRSCIVNLSNIKHIDFEEGIINFGSKTIDLLSRANKRELKEKLR